MARRLLLTASSFALAFSVSARAEHGWGLFGSYWDTKDGSDAPGVGLSLSFELLPNVLLDFRTSYFDDLGDESGGTDVDVEVVPFEFGLLFATADDATWQFMGGGGLGFYRMDADVVSSSGVIASPSIDDEWGFYVAGGVEYTLSRNVEAIQATRATLFLEGVYRYVEADRVTTESGTAVVVQDGDLSGPGANLGLKQRW